jgi:hypothetical protein
MIPNRLKVSVLATKEKSWSPKAKSKAIPGSPKTFVPESLTGGIEVPDRSGRGPAPPARPAGLVALFRQNGPPAKMGPLASFPQSFRSGRAFCLAKTPRPEPSFWQNEAKKLNDCREGGPFHVPGARVWNAGTARWPVPLSQRLGEAGHWDRGWWLRKLVPCPAFLGTGRGSCRLRPGSAQQNECDVVRDQQRRHPKRRDPIGWPSTIVLRLMPFPPSPSGRPGLSRTRRRSSGPC